MQGIPFEFDKSRVFGIEMSYMRFRGSTSTVKEILDERKRAVMSSPIFLTKRGESLPLKSLTRTWYR